MGIEMENDYREKWCQFFASLLMEPSYYGSMHARAKLADEALVELKKRDTEKFFEKPDKGYRK